MRTWILVLTVSLLAGTAAHGQATQGSHYCRFYRADGMGIFEFGVPGEFVTHRYLAPERFHFVPYRFQGHSQIRTKEKQGRLWINDKPHGIYIKTAADWARVKEEGEHLEISDEFPLTLDFMEKIRPYLRGRIVMLNGLDNSSLHLLKEFEGILGLDIGFRRLDEGALISSLRHLTSLRYLRLRSVQLTDRGVIEGISGLSGLSYLDLSFNPITDKGAIEGLSKLTGLKYLNLTSSLVGDQGVIEGLSKLTHLTELIFDTGTLTDRGVIQGLTRLKNLKRLDIGKAKITDQALDNGLSRLEGLLFIELYDIKTLSEDALIRFFRKQQKLIALSLTGLSVTDRVAREGLSWLKELRYLNCEGAPLGNKGFEAILRSLSKLFQFHVVDTRVDHHYCNQIAPKYRNVSIWFDTSGAGSCLGGGGK